MNKTKQKSQNIKLGISKPSLGLNFLKESDL